MTVLKLKRVYQSQCNDDGFRVFVDKLWPRGLSHETFHYDDWEKGIAPSKDLREWFHENRSGNWDIFRKKYEAELKSNPDWPVFISKLKSHPIVTLLYSSRDTTENNAVIIYNLLLAEFPGDFKE